MGKSQKAAFNHLLKSEEKSAAFEIRKRIEAILNSMPHTYETEKKKLEEKYYLHFFRGGCDFYISELDISSKPDGEDEIGVPEDFQWQMFGSANLGYGAELGYICLKELLDNGIELDFHFEPSTETK